MVYTFKLASEKFLSFFSYILKKISSGDTSIHNLFEIQNLKILCGAGQLLNELSKVINICTHYFVMCNIPYFTVVYLHRLANKNDSYSLISTFKHILKTTLTHFMPSSQFVEDSN